MKDKTLTEVWNSYKNKYGRPKLDKRRHQREWEAFANIVKKLHQEPLSTEAKSAVKNEVMVQNNNLTIFQPEHSPNYTHPRFALLGSHRALIDTVTQ